MEWALLGPQLSAQEAERWGLVYRVVPLEELEAATLELAHELAQGPTQIYGFTKSAVIHGWEVAPERPYEYQGQAFLLSHQTEDFGEGRKVFLEKRPPVFRAASRRIF